MKKEIQHLWVTMNWEGDGLYRKCIKCEEVKGYNDPMPSIGCTTNNVLSQYSHLKKRGVVV